MGASPGRAEVTVFLTAEWRQLLMLSWFVDPTLLAPFVPAGTRLDTWQGRTFVSIVGFLFLRTRLLGVPVPLHSRFEEVNLRFYVRREGLEGVRRGVVFIKEIVPKRAVAAVARWLYGEPYQALPMESRIEAEDDRPRTVEYRWRFQGRWNALGATVVGAAEKPSLGSEEEFITEHYWGYTALPGGRAREYRVEHEPWRVRRVEAPELDCDASALYGEPLAEILSTKPDSALLADGSPVLVHFGRVL